MKKTFFKDFIYRNTEMLQVAQATIETMATNLQSTTVEVNNFTKTAKLQANITDLVQQQ